MVLAHITDWYPTLLAATGLSDVADRSAFPLDGYNLWPALTGHKQSPRDSVLLNIEDGKAAVIKGNMKLMLGGPFLQGRWQCPPEVCADPHATDMGIDCQHGCLINLETDPREEHPRSPKNTVEESQGNAFRATLDEMISLLNDYNKTYVPALFDEYGPSPDPKGTAMAKKHGAWRPWSGEKFITKHPKPAAAKKPVPKKAARKPVPHHKSPPVKWPKLDDFKV